MTELVIHEALYYGSLVLPTKVNDATRLGLRKSLDLGQGRVTRKELP